MLESDKLEASPAGKQRLIAAYKEAGLTQESLATKAGVSTDTIKRLLGTKACTKGIERRMIRRIAQVVKLEPIDIVAHRDWYGESLPAEFEALIKEKTRIFVGRDFVRQGLQTFIKENDCGYFTVIGDAGMGKSAIAAKYVDDYYAPCFFNILVEGRNRPELCLNSLRPQLQRRYQLPNVERDDLATLLGKVATKLTPGEKVVIVVDALDEVEQEPSSNLLHLPTTLPPNIYFLLTRRPYNQGKKRLRVDPGVPMQELDLGAAEYQDFNRQDIQAYIRFFLHEDPDYQNILQTWLTTKQLTEAEFITQLAEKSENNFMYLRYVIPALAEGYYDNLSLQQLPQGLQEYYQTHWQRMGMEEAGQKLMAIILFILVEMATPPTCEMITAIADCEAYETEKILEEQWVEYIKQQVIEGETCYSIYHASFQQFLSKQRELKKTRKLFQEVNERISQCVYEC